jgi:hypothetical protein
VPIGVVFVLFKWLTRNPIIERVDQTSSASLYIELDEILIEIEWQSDPRGKSPLGSDD